MLDLCTDIVSIQGETNNSDISLFIQDSLRNRPGMHKWPAEVKTKIEETLVNGAVGMYVPVPKPIQLVHGADVLDNNRFIWVSCQLDTLEKCVSVDSIYKALESLPRSLADIYERILLSIDNELAVSAHKLLTWLMFCERPLRVEEGKEILCIEGYEFPVENRLYDAQDVLNICPRFIKVIASSGNKNDPETATLSLAHHTVREFLLDRFSSSPSASYHITSAIQSDLVWACLTYLGIVAQTSLVFKDTITPYSFADYAAGYWYAHAKKAEEHPDEESMKNYLRALDDFTSDRRVFANSIRLSDPDQAWESDLQKPEDEIAEPLYYMALTGLDRAVLFLLSSKGANVNSRNE